MTDEEIFKSGSTTYYFSSKFFSKRVREDVFKLYSFVRVADNYVDAQPQDVKNFHTLVDQWQIASNSGTVTTKNELIAHVVTNMVQVSNKYNFDAVWVTAFLASMQMDIDKKQYKTMQDTLMYVYGSAEVIGLMMARILGADGGVTTEMATGPLPHDVLEKDEHTFGSYGASHAKNSATLKSKAIPKRKRTKYDMAAAVQRYARLQGRAMQYINFIRDINEDLTLGRCYFPKSELNKYALDKITEKTALRNPAEFREFIEGQLAYYHAWQQEAAHGFKAVPYRQRIALQTAVDMYNWTAKKIADDPYSMFQKKIKPNKYRVILQAVMRSINV